MADEEGGRGADLGLHGEFQREPVGVIGNPHLDRAALFEHALGGAVHGGREQHRIALARGGVDLLDLQRGDGQGVKLIVEQHEGGVGGPRLQIPGPGLDEHGDEVHRPAARRHGQRGVALGPERVHVTGRLTLVVKVHRHQRLLFPRRGGGTGGGQQPVHGVEVRDHLAGEGVEHPDDALGLGQGGHPRLRTAVNFVGAGRHLHLAGIAEDAPAHPESERLPRLQGHRLAGPRGAQAGKQQGEQ